MSTESREKPIEPRKPEPQECCGTGCIPCVMDLYEESLERYKQELAAWDAALASRQDAALSPKTAP